MASRDQLREQTRELLSNAIGFKYVVLEWIGGGGMADVYVARHRRTGSLRAIKVLADHLSRDETLVGQFLQEARTAVRLEGHPNIVRIDDVGEDADRGLYYMVMEFIEGEDLGAYLKRVGRLSPVESMFIIQQVASGLREAHAKGVIHRDLKPANIRIDTRGRAVVLDFGIAKVGSSPTAMTQMGFRVGTPHYMAPEQIMGTTDRRSDIYALGVLAFKLLTGKLPFNGANEQAIWHAHLNLAPPVPHEVDTSIPPQVSNIILKLLEKDPDKRYHSCDELIRDLDKFKIPTRAPSTLRPSVGRDVERWKKAEPGEDQVDPRHATNYSPNAGNAASAGVPPGTGEFNAGMPGTSATPAPHYTGSQQVPVTTASQPWKIPAIVAGAILMLALVGVGLYFAMGGGSGGGSAELPEPDHPKVIQTATGRMLLVTGGEFIFGSRDTNYASFRQTVELPAFYVDELEVSNAQYKKFCDETGRAYPPNPNGQSDYFNTYQDNPVVNVSYEDAVEYARWAGDGKRLPTEQEWEKAARGQDGYTYPWGSTPTPDRDRANVAGQDDNFDDRTADVRAFPEGKSPYGALNMIGNVWEWTDTEYTTPTERDMEDRTAMFQVPAEGSWRYLKGGAYVIDVTDQAQAEFLKASARYPVPQVVRHETIGFRLVKDADAPQ